MLAETINNLLPDAWHICNVVFLDPDWQVIAADDDYVVVATGETIEAALAQAVTKIHLGKYAGSFSIGNLRAPEAPKVDLMQLMRKKVDIVRRV